MVNKKHIPYVSKGTFTFIQETYILTCRFYMGVTIFIFYEKSETIENENRQKQNKTKFWFYLNLIFILKDVYGLKEVTKIRPVHLRRLCPNVCLYTCPSFFSCIFLSFPFLILIPFLHRQNL